jgi:hypothetical protein
MEDPTSLDLCHQSKDFYGFHHPQILETNDDCPMIVHENSFTVGIDACVNINNR